MRVDLKRYAAEFIGTFVLVALGPGAVIGFWSVRRFPGKDVPPYIVAQSLGAIAASAVLGWVVGPVGNFGATVPAIPITKAFAGMVVAMQLYEVLRGTGAAEVPRGPPIGSEGPIDG